MTRKTFSQIMPTGQDEPDGDSQQLTSGVKPRATPAWLLEGQPARIYFVVALIAFTAAAAGWVISSLLTGWMEIVGMLALGLFYLGLGLLEIGRRAA